MLTMKKLFLVDVSSMFFRAFYAIRQLSNSKGMPTNAVYGFISMIVKLMKDHQVDYIAFCFDLPTPSFRKEIYGEYKANRTEMPEDLIPQIPYIKKVTEALGIPMFEQVGYEADDLIGALTNYGLRHNMEVLIVSGDKDFSQLIGEQVCMLDTMKNLRIGRAEVIEKYGVAPESFIDYLALTGDSSDNIPGVRGVGPKGAQKLIEQFGSIEGIYEKIDEVKNPGLKIKLSEAKEMAFLSKKLVTIVQDIPLNIEPMDLRQKPIHREDLEALLTELDFHSFKKVFLADGATAATSTSDANFHASAVKVEEKTAEEIVDNSPLVVSQGPLVIAAQALGAAAETPENISVTSMGLEAFAAWLKKRNSFWIVDRERQFIFADGEEVVVYEGDEKALAELFDRQTKVAWKGFDLKPTWRQLCLKNPHVAQWDSFLAAYVVRAGAVESFRETYQLYVQRNLPEIPDPASLYQAQLDLEKVLLAKLKETHMEQILKTIELPVIDILEAMESKGVLIDVEFLKKESKTLGDDIKELEKQIHYDAGENFNIASPKQLGHILFEKMQLPKGKKTKTGYSTNNDVLEKLEDLYPIASKIIKYRELSKLKSTYVDALPLLVNEKTGRVHTQFNQALTSTGRLSSVQPNLQNIPIRTERGLRIRRGFIAAPGHVLVSGDYSQIELRILAHISKDEGLREAFAQDLDIHTKAASEIFEVPLDQVTEDLRRKAKAVNFGIAYGQGAHGLAEGLGISRGEAKVIIDKYFMRFQGVKTYMQNAVEFVKEHEYAETILGRRRYLPEINGKNHMIKAFAERAAINAPIQGMSSDLVKMAMIEVSREYRDRLILQVHDELIFELPEDENLKTHMDKIKDLMENCMKLDVPLRVNMNYGRDWSQV
jgi:DNA polymerase-1